MVKNKLNLVERSTKGFTLIELLIVVSIIALLSSIAFYSMTEAKLRGEDTKNISQAREVQNSMEIYRSQKNSYPVSATSVGLYREGTTEYNDVMQELVDEKYIPEIPTSSNGSSYYYEQKEDGTASFLTALFSEKYGDLFSGCYITDLNGNCSFDETTYIIESCDDSNQCNDYHLSSNDSVISSGGGSSNNSLCGDSHNRAHDSYSYSEACSSEAATNGQINEEYNGTQQWGEWVCVDSSDSSNTETCQTLPEPTTPTACGIGTTGAGGVDWFVGFNSALPSSNQVSSFSSNSNDGVYRENTYCSIGVYNKRGSYSIGGPRTYQWRCYTGSSSGIGDAGSYTSCQYTDN